MAVSETILNHIHESLRDRSNGEVSNKAKELAEHYGVSVQTVFRWAAMKGLRWRKEKSTKGTSSVSRDAAVKAGALLMIAKRSSKDIPLPACDAKEILDESGLDTGGVTASWFRARMRKERVSAKDILRPAPHQRLLSDHPNHVWQFDVTNCIQYFLDEKKGMGERDADMELYKNKIVKTAKQIRKELLRYAVVDHCTGVFYFRYFYASGERAIDGSQFLFEAMRPKDELIERIWNGASAPKVGKYRFQGVPFVLVADRGSIAAAKANQNLFDALRIKLEPHLPGNPRAKGAIEGLMKIINRFEGRLKLDRPSDLDDLNRRALDWCIGFNGTKDMRGVAPRSILWSKITETELRLCPDETLYRLLIREPEIERTADGSRIIKVDNRFYRIEDPNAAYQKVKVVRHPYEYPNIEVHFNGFVWLCQPIPQDEFGRLTIGTHYGEYKDIKHTEAQKAKTEMEKVAAGWGIKFKGAGEKRIAEAAPVGHASPLQVFGHQADKVGNVEFMNKKGTPLDVKEPELPANRPLRMDAAEVSRGISSRRISVVEFLKKLKDEIGVVSPALNQAIRERYGSGIEIKEAEEVIGKIQDGTWLNENEAIHSTG